jgi:predicted metal-dependent HD superfamily phosphohydrolase
MPTETDWRRTWQGLGLPRADLSMSHTLLGRYAEPHRKYHTRQHLDACLKHFEAVRHTATHPHEIELALWFHDAVYDIPGAGNEAKSADWARDVLLAAGASNEVSARVHALVMATRHDTRPQTPDQEVLLDVDLAILGAPAALFDAYETQIRAEYASVPDDAFRRGRKRILEQFLARKRIFHTHHFSSRYEAQARANLCRSIEQLKDR